VSASHEPLYGVNGPFWVGNRLPARRFSDDCFVFVIERYYARSNSITFSIRDYLRLTALHDRYNTIGCAEVDADYLFTLNHR
jgi:hypothetical protein